MEELGLVNDQHAEHAEDYGRYQIADVETRAQDAQRKEAEHRAEGVSRHREGEGDQIATVS